MIVDLSKYTPSVYVDLEPGIYVFPAMSAEGKTYLSSTLHELRKRERVDSHTYVDDFRPGEFFDRSKRDLVMLDRYDLYVGQCESEMKAFSESGIVLVDCKSNLNNVGFLPCSIDLSETGVVVYDTLSDRG